MQEKIIKFRWIIEILIVLLLAAYGFIFNSFNGRVSSVEGKVNELNPVLLRIQTDIAGIKVDIGWLREKNK